MSSLASRRPGRRSNLRRARSRGPAPNPLAIALVAAGLAGAVIALGSAPARAQEAPIGRIKTETGAVTLERAGRSRPAAIGDPVFRADTLVTAARSSVGVTFSDNSLMALGPFSRLSLDLFRFDATTHAGAFDVTLHRGALAVKSGQIVRQTPEAMRVRTPAALLGVRGTEFVVRAENNS